MALIGCFIKHGRIHCPTGLGVKRYSASWKLANENLAKVVLYHEVMWDMLDVLVGEKIITQPDILKGGPNAHKKDFGQIVYIVE